MQTQPHEDWKIANVTSHLATDADPLAICMHPIHDVFQKAHKAGMPDAGEGRDFSVVAVDRKKVLIQIIGAYTEEVNLCAKLIEDKGHRGHFNHDPDWHGWIERDTLISQFILRLRDLRLQPDDLLDRGDHGRHDLKPPECGSAENGPQLCAKELAVLRINSHSAITEERVRFGRQVQVRNRFVAANVDRADDYRPLPGSLRRGLVDAELFFLGWRAILSDEEHLGSEESNSFRAVRAGGRNLLRR